MTTPLGSPPPPVLALPPGLPADCYALGPPSAVFPPDKGQGCLQQAVYGFLLGFGVCCLICGGIIHVAATEEPGKSNTGMVVIMAVLAAPFLAFGGHKLRQQRRHMGQTVWLCPGGFVSARRRSAAAFPWDAIDGVNRQVTHVYLDNRHARTDHVYTVRRADGLVRVFNWHLTDVATLGERVVEQVNPRALRRATEAIHAGGRAAFGRLGLSAAVVSCGDRSVPWADVEAVEAEGGSIAVRRRGQRRAAFKAKVADVPNAEVFVALARAMAKDAGGGR